MPRITHLLLGGGGFSGISYIGILEGLQMWGYANDIHTVTGISVGALVGACFVAGIPMSFLIHLYNAFVDDARHRRISLSNFLSFQRTLSVYDPAPIMDMLATCFRRRWPDKDPAAMTLAEFRRLTKRTFNVLVTDLVASTSVTLNADTHPDVPVLTAVRAAIAIPCVISPVTWRDQCWIDGWVTADNPFVAHAACPIAPETALYISLGGDGASSPTPTKSMSAYIQALIRAFLRNKSEDIYPQFCHHRIDVKAPVVAFLPIRWKQQSMIIDVTRDQVRDSFLQGMDLFMNWRTTFAAP
jgi:hypothetical protein